MKDGGEDDRNQRVDRRDRMEVLITNFKGVQR